MFDPYRQVPTRTSPGHRAHRLYYFPFTINLSDVQGSQGARFMAFMSSAMTCTVFWLTWLVDASPGTTLCRAQFSCESRSGLLTVNSFGAETERNCPPFLYSTFRSSVMTSAYAIPVEYSQLDTRADTAKPASPASAHALHDISRADSAQARLLR